MIVIDREDARALAKSAPARRNTHEARPVRRRCEVCGNTGAVLANPTGINGAQEIVDCPHCSPR
jgi:hypothetical protein